MSCQDQNTAFHRIESLHRALRLMTAESFERIHALFVSRAVFTHICGLRSRALSAVEHIERAACTFLGWRTISVRLHVSDLLVQLQVICLQTLHLFHAGNQCDAGFAKRQEARW